MKMINTQVEVGKSKAKASGRTWLGLLLGDQGSANSVKRSIFNSGQRTYYKNKVVWVCATCYESSDGPSDGLTLLRTIIFFLVGLLIAPAMFLWNKFRNEQSVNRKWAWFTAIAIIFMAASMAGAFVVRTFLNMGSADPSTHSKAATPVEKAAPAKSKNGETASPDFAKATTPQDPPERELSIELTEPANSKSAERDTVQLHAAGPSAMSSASATSPRVASPPKATVDEYDRIYSDEEIWALEDQKQYHGSDSMVRSRLGIPSRETRRLIR
jgi:hypothetical protein